MKILIVNFSDIEGGAARAAYRLHKSLLNEGIDSKMLVQKKSSDDFTVLAPQTTYEKSLVKINAVLNPLPLYFYKSKSNFSASFISSSKIIEKINKLNPDIVHLHWIHAGMLKIEDLEKINAPLVWSLHDMWAFTGGCHYDKECGAYMESCGNCKVLNSHKKNDLSMKIFLRKKKSFSKIQNLTIIGLSSWLEDCAKKSSLFKRKKIVNLPNPINTNIFKPINKIEARNLWNLPVNKKLILFGAMNATGDSRKGFQELTTALSRLKNADIELVIFGSSLPENPTNFGFKTHYLGHLNDDITLVTLYNAVDLMVVPSLQENLSNAIMESLACGTPVVGFNIGGNSDMLDHYKNGYLAKPFDIIDLKNGIEWVLNNKNYDEISQNAREKVAKQFDSKVVAKKYIDLYKQEIEEKNNASI